MVAKTYAGLKLTPSLVEGAEEQAVKVLREYFLATTSNGHPRYSGGQFDSWDPSNTRAASADTFTADDLVAVSFLAVDVPGDAAIQLQKTRREEFDSLLKAVGSDRDLADESNVADGDFPVWPLWHALMGLPSIGPTTASKLLARKRPRLVPIFDSVIKEHLLGGNGSQWAPLRAALAADNRAFHVRMLALRDAADLPEEISPLRILDVLAWMDGSGRTAKLMTPVEA